MHLHARNARFSARVVHARGVEVTLAVPRGVPAAARPLPAECEMSFEHNRQIVMLSGTLMGGEREARRLVAVAGSVRRGWPLHAGGVTYR